MVLLFLQHKIMKKSNIKMYLGGFLGCCCRIWERGNGVGEGEGEGGREEESEEENNEEGEEEE